MKEQCYNKKHGKVFTSIPRDIQKYWNQQQTFSFHFARNSSAALSMPISSSFFTALLHFSSDCLANVSGRHSLSNWSWSLALLTTAVAIFIHDSITDTRSNFWLAEISWSRSISSSVKRCCSAYYKPTDSIHSVHKIIQHVHQQQKFY